MPMFVLVVIMITSLILPLVIKLDSIYIFLFEIIDWIIWAIFFVELSVRLYIAPKRSSYLRKNWLDVLVVVLPFMRVFRIFRVLRFARILTVFSKFTQKLKAIFSQHGFHYIVVVFIGVILIGTILIYYFDKGTALGIKNMAESLWLVITIAFSGGFGDIFPATTEAKTITILVIIVGNVLVSYFTASLASYFAEKDQDIEQERIERKLNELNKNIIALKNQLKK
ncbi:MAG: hypothetical protein UR89_C0032G0016 [Candidatus Roizmanbacteria bacterium GW2011_GWA2_35_8]|uniref:Ion transport domain-containing protein n=1 Tax=Candidatus Roizmanbacteria bacterium GW2011_GWA2_35_8 TaxID=1618479 RepID=A0A0G0CYM4_9BACT|nr:MAG: hypothetical protein UR89_C0032G0016 [Candidatus Roizmanbacteria bacterium GW2011_GWA2_35_8]